MRSDMKHQIVLFISCFVLIGCGSTHTKFRGPNGRTAYSMILCGSGYLNCLQSASKYCPKGYDIIDKNTYTSGLYNVPKRSMSIECKE